MVYTVEDSTKSEVQAYFEDLMLGSTRGTIPLTVFRPFSISRFLIRANGPRR
ncbi:hypothetical protein C7458_1382 [Williamsia muralis]|nr:hypothetical protein C7458_1382 [Williamsia marianensis]